MTRDGADPATTLAGLDPLPTLEAGRVRLRPAAAKDVDGFLALFGDPRVARWTSLPCLTSRADAEAFHASVLEHHARRDLLQWTIADAEDDRLLGTVTLAHVEPLHRRAEIGYAVLHAEQGRGIGRAASTRLLRFAFEGLALERIEADVDPRNAASLHLLDSQGFRVEGHLRRRYRIADEWHDAVLLGLLREDWSRAPMRA